MEQPGQCKDGLGTAVSRVQTRGSWEDFFGSSYSENPWVAECSLDSLVKSGFILGQLQKIPQIFLRLFFGVELITSAELKFTHSSIYLTSTMG